MLPCFSEWLHKSCLNWCRRGRSSPVHNWWKCPLWLDRLSLRFSSASQNRPGQQSETWLSASHTHPSQSCRWKPCYQSHFLAVSDNETNKTLSSDTADNMLVCCPQSNIIHLIITTCHLPKIWHLLLQNELWQIKCFGLL